MAGTAGCFEEPRVQLSGERTVAASRQAVWVALNDPAILCRCLPGCESIERVSDAEFTLAAGPVAGLNGTLSRGQIRLDDVDPPSGYRFVAELRAEGDDEPATVGGRVELAAEGDGTRLRYQVALGRAGKLMKEGASEAAVRALAEEILIRFEKAVADAQPNSTGAPVPHAPAEASADEARPALRPSIWVPALMLAVAVILFAATWQ